MNTPSTLLIGLAVCATLLCTTPARATSPRKVTIDQQNLMKLALADQQRVLCIADRLEEITAMDRSTMGRMERKALRSELSALKGEADGYNRAGGGNVVYISGAGLIIIILLLIIIL